MCEARVACFPQELARNPFSCHTQEARVACFPQELAGNPARRAGWPASTVCP